MTRATEAWVSHVVGVTLGGSPAFSRQAADSVTADPRHGLSSWRAGESGPASTRRTGITAVGRAVCFGRT